MFFFNKSKWEKLQEDYSIQAYFREGIAKLMIPFKIDIKKFCVNLDCFENRYSYSYKYGQGSTFSMISLAEAIDTWNLPLGYPNWFYAAFPDVVCWLLTKEGFDAVDQQCRAINDTEAVDPNSRKLKVDILRLLVDNYLEVKSKKLEVSRVH